MGMAGEPAARPTRLGVAHPRYWMTSVACCTMDGGMVSPSVRAIFRFTTTSNVLGWSVGGSAWLAPLRTGRPDLRHDQLLARDPAASVGTTSLRVQLLARREAAKMTGDVALVTRLRPRKPRGPVNLLTERCHGRRIVCGLLEAFRLVQRHDRRGRLALRQGNRSGNSDVTGHQWLSPFCAHA